MPLFGFQRSCCHQPPILQLFIITAALLIAAFYASKKYQENQRWWQWDEYLDNRPAAEAHDKIIVMGKLQRENTDWVDEYLPDWQHAIYTVDNTSAPLHTPTNKGKEAMAYLTYIIDHYHHLPSIIVFLHSHRISLPPIAHNDALNHDSTHTLKSLQLPHVLSNGYVNLRCVADPGCTPKHTRRHEHVNADIWAQVFRGSKEGREGMPERIGVACCAQFAVSGRQVRERGLQEYRGFREWLLETELDDEKSGRVFEYLWHVIFGRDTVHCPELQSCYCSVFGKCA